MRTRVSVTLFAAAGLLACGDSGSVPEGGSAASTSSAVVSQPTPTSSTVGEPKPSADDTTSPSPPASDVDPGDAAEPLARCADIAPMTTDVLSETERGNIDPVLHGVLLTYAAEHVDTFGGLWIDRDAFGTVVLAFTDDPAPHLEALDQRRPSTDDVHAVEPPPEIIDDRPIGEWDVAFDVVQVAHTEAELVGAVSAVTGAVGAVTATPMGGYVDVERNRVGVELSAPISREDLIAVTDAIESLEAVEAGMVCWDGQLVDEAPEPVQPGAPLDIIRLPGDEGVYPPDTPVSCDALHFELGDLEQLTPAGDAGPQLRSVLEDWLADPEGQYWPQDGWSLLDENDERATFIHVADDGVSYVDAEMGANGWIWAGAGGGGPCDVQLRLPEGLAEVEWILDPASPPPDASSTEVHVLATERGCASGQAMGDRLLGPQVVETADMVRIAFAVVPAAGAQECPGNPSTPVVVELDDPLGDREIRDGTMIGPITTLTDA